MTTDLPGRCAATGCLSHSRRSTTQAAARAPPACTLPAADAVETSSSASTIPNRAGLYSPPARSAHLEAYRPSLRQRGSGNSRSARHQPYSRRPLASPAPRKLPYSQQELVAYPACQDLEPHTTSTRELLPLTRVPEARPVKRPQTVVQTTDRLSSTRDSNREQQGP